jgi:hypothetical protein
VNLVELCRQRRQLAPDDIERGWREELQNNAKEHRTDITKLKATSENRKPLTSENRKPLTSEIREPLTSENRKALTTITTTRQLPHLPLLSFSRIDAVIQPGGGGGRAAVFVRTLHDTPSSIDQRVGQVSIGARAKSVVAL